MKSFSLIATAAVAIVLTSCDRPVREQPGKVQLSKDELIKKGSYLVKIGGCHDCHSPKVMTEFGPVPDTSRLLSGHPHEQPFPDGPSLPPGTALFAPGQTAAKGPWGISYAANLTPDDTGIGNWTFEQFETAIRKGKYKGLEKSRPLMPPMPWQMYQNFSDEDLRAVFTYLKSLKPVDNLVPPIITMDKLQSINTINQ
ncbi:MAG: diheme cytochrome c-553 [Bacteroidota bacterium]